MILGLDNLRKINTISKLFISPKFYKNIFCGMGLSYVTNSVIISNEYGDSFELTGKHEFEFDDWIDFSVNPINKIKSNIELTLLIDPIKIDKIYIYYWNSDDEDHICGILFENANFKPILITVIMHSHESTLELSFFEKNQNIFESNWYFLNLRKELYHYFV
jgi:hypothetical protein